MCRGAGYVINVTAYSTEDNIISTTEYADPANFIIQFDICANITKPVNAACNVTAPAYMVGCNYLYSRSLYVSHDRPL